jgi:hypothetical protein
MDHLNSSFIYDIALVPENEKQEEKNGQKVKHGKIEDESFIFILGSERTPIQRKINKSEEKEKEKREKPWKSMEKIEQRPGKEGRGNIEQKEKGNKFRNVDGGTGLPYRREFGFDGVTEIIEGPAQVVELLAAFIGDDGLGEDVPVEIFEHLLSYSLPRHRHRYEEEEEEEEEDLCLARILLSPLRTRPKFLKQNFSIIPNSALPSHKP